MAYDLPFYKLNKPELTEIDREKALDEAMSKIPKDFFEFFQKVNSPKYLYWTEARSKANFQRLSAEGAWYVTRFNRDIFAQKTPIKSESGDFFKWIRLPITDEYLNKIDLHSGNIFSKINSQKNDKLIIRGIMEEAIASSQLEGAHTTRAVAKKMILEKRLPTNESEQMILNNYRSMLSIDEDYKNQELSLELIFELHKKLTDKTEAAEGQGRLRRDEDEVVVKGLIGQIEYITHVPPKNLFLEKEIQRLIDFANDKDEQEFIHPVIKAIFIHFWIAYLHPFSDGNGRLARALFYWYLLRKDYWNMMYLPISTVIRQSPAQYAMAYIHSEQDNLDLTYFYDFHIRKIIQALNEFKEYLDHKVKENNQLSRMVGEKMILNEREKMLLQYLISDHQAASTVSSYSEINHITRQTAAKDLKYLENNGLLISRREGKYIRYYASDDFRKQKLNL